MNGTWWGLVALGVSMVCVQPARAQEGGAGGMGGAAMSDGGGGFGGSGGDGGWGGDEGLGGDGGEPPWPIDNDGDGFSDDVDCDDSRADVYPGANEYAVDCDAGEPTIDKDCDGYPAECYYGSHDGGGVPLANFVGTVLFGLWLGGAAWRRRRS